MATMEMTHSRLTAAIDARRLQLRMEWGELAVKAEMSTAHLRRIRKGEASVTPLMAARLEDALGWTRGSIEAIESGGEPTQAPGSQPRAAGSVPRTGQTLGELLVERRLARPEDLTAADNIIDDPVAWEIIEMGEVTEESRNELLQAYAHMRRVMFRAAQSKKKRPRV